MSALERAIRDIDCRIVWVPRWVFSQPRSSGSCARSPAAAASRTLPVTRPCAVPVSAVALKLAPSLNATPVPACESNNEAAISRNHAPATNLLKALERSLEAGYGLVADSRHECDHASAGAGLQGSSGSLAECPRLQQNGNH
jgi:hypothetical protein